jgi:hypothetical protein
MTPHDHNEDEGSGTATTRALWWVLGIIVSVLLSVGSYAFVYTQERINKTENKADSATLIDAIQGERLATVEADEKAISARLERIEDF